MSSLSSFYLTYISRAVAQFQLRSPLLQIIDKEKIFCVDPEQVVVKYLYLTDEKGFCQPLKVDTSVSQTTSVGDLLTKMDFALLGQDEDEDRKSTSPFVRHGRSDRWQKKATHGDKPLSIVHNDWEYLDPTPDLHSMFLQFNQQFFWGKLAGVEVRWSPRMTLCAGLCSYEGRGGLCSVRLSVPLLKLRPRKDLVETLLHEMIHAYLFVTANNKDHNSHGTEFHDHMYRINRNAGTNITVYHTFHNEVNSYRQHWWRCSGPCQQRPPYFGIVRRAMNRPPGPTDFWWAQHQATCGGTYTKIKEPEGYKGSKEGSKLKEANKRDIRSFFPFGGKGHMVGKEKMGKASEKDSSSQPVEHNHGVTKLNGIVSKNFQDSEPGVIGVSGALNEPGRNSNGVFSGTFKVPSRVIDKGSVVNGSGRGAVIGKVKESYDFSMSATTKVNCGRYGWGRNIGTIGGLSRSSGAVSVTVSGTEKSRRNGKDTGNHIGSQLISEPCGPLVKPFVGQGYRLGGEGTRWKHQGSTVSQKSGNGHGSPTKLVKIESPDRNYNSKNPGKIHLKKYLQRYWTALDTTGNTSPGATNFIQNQSECASPVFVDSISCELSSSLNNRMKKNMGLFGSMDTGRGSNQQQDLNRVESNAGNCFGSNSSASQICTAINMRNQCNTKVGVNNQNAVKSVKVVPAATVISSDNKDESLLCRDSDVLVHCPMCDVQVRQGQINQHLDSCIELGSDTWDVDDSNDNQGGKNSTVTSGDCTESGMQSSKELQIYVGDCCESDNSEPQIYILNQRRKDSDTRMAVGNQNVTKSVDLITRNSNNTVQSLACKDNDAFVQCPLCDILVRQGLINKHIDTCPEMRSDLSEVHQEEYKNEEKDTALVSDDIRESGMGSSDDDISGNVTCPICDTVMKVEEINTHLDVCMQIA